MMNKFFGYTIFAASFLSILYSCKENQNIPVQSNPKTHNFWSFERNVPQLDNLQNRIKSERNHELSLTEVRDRFLSRSVPTQEIIINANKDTLLILREGTRVQLKANTMVSKKTGLPINGKVKLVAKEYYNVSDCIREGVSTQTSDRALESAGMVYLKAYSNNEECELAADKTIQLAFASNSNMENMDIFYGNKGSDNTISWEMDPMDNVRGVNSSRVLSGPWRPKHKRTHRGRYFSKTPHCLYCEDLFTSEGLSFLREYMNPGQISSFQIRMVLNNSGKQDSLYLVKGLGNEGDRLLLQHFKDVNYWLPNTDIEPERFKDQIFSFLLKVGNFEQFYAYPHTITSVHMPLEGYFGIMEARAQREKEFLITDKERVRKYNEMQTKLNEKNEDIISNISTSDISQYIYESQNLGWINCDRFYDQPPVSLLVKNSSPGNENVFIVIKNRRSLLIPGVQHNNFVYDALPLGETAIIFGFKVNNGELQMATEEVILESENTSILAYNSVSYADLERQLVEFDIAR